MVEGITDSLHSGVVNESFVIYLLLFSIIILITHVFQKSYIPIPLILVIVGMLLSTNPYFPEIILNPNLVLNFFLPLLIYEISSFSSWRDMKKQLYPIVFLTIGHVIFITILVAIVIHALLPQMGWPLAFMLGAIISPPDDVAIVAVAEKINIPESVFIILKGEAMFNSAAALTLFRFALAAAFTVEFSLTHAFSTFTLIIIGEIIYGLLLGHVIGQLRTKITNTSLHLIVSIVTPFIAYIPMVKLGGSGIIATAIVGFVIGNYYALRFTPEYRLSAFMIWPTIGFAIQSILFLLVGLDMHVTVSHISSIPIGSLLLYVFSVLAVIIVGRFIWVYGTVYVFPRFLFPSSRKAYPPWQYPLVISWAGIRGGISLAAALAVPAFTLSINGADPRDLVIFLTFCVIFVTLILQGLSLPFLLNAIGIGNIGKSERYSEHITELQARLQMINAALDWMREYKKLIKDDKTVLDELNIHLTEYKLLSKQYESRIDEHGDESVHDEEREAINKFALLNQIIEIERAEITRLWHEDKVNLRVRNKLMAILDHQIQRYNI